MTSARETFVVRAGTTPAGRARPIHIPTNDDAEMREIEREIDSTRHEMAHTINQLEERLRPRRLVDDARETLRDATIGKVERTMDDVRFRAQTTGSGILGTIRANPMAATLAAAGLGWLWMSRSNGSNQPREAYRARDYYYPSDSAYGYAGGGQATQSAGPTARIAGTVDATRDSARKMAEGARGTVADVADSAADVASTTRERAGEVAEEVVDRAQEAARMAQRRTSMAQSDMQRVFHDNPLGVAAVAIAVGAGVGLLTPSTEPETRLFGSAGERLRERAMETAQEAGDKVQRVAQEAGRAAQREASS